MTDSDRPPLLCPTCTERQVHHPLDPYGMAYYCPHVHGGVYAIRSKRGDGWLMRTGFGGPDAARAFCEASILVLAAREDASAVDTNPEP